MNGTAAEVTATAPTVRTSLDGTGTSSYHAQPAGASRPTAPDSSRESTCNDPQQGAVSCRSAADTVGADGAEAEREGSAPAELANAAVPLRHDTADARPTNARQVSSDDDGGATSTATATPTDAHQARSGDDDAKAAPIAQALRAIGDEEMRRVFRERFDEVFAGTSFRRPEFTGRRCPTPPKGIARTSNGWRAVRGDANTAGRTWHNRAAAIEACGKNVVVLRCKRCGNVWAIPDACGSRFCPKCVRAVRQRNIAEIQKVVQQIGGRRRFVTLTVRSNHDLRRMLNNVSSSFVRLRARDWWQRHVTAGIYAVEVTHNPDAGWHVHIHAIVWGAYMPRPWLVSEWQAATGCRCPRPRKPAPGAKPVLCCHSAFDDRDEMFLQASAAASRCNGCPVEPSGQDIRAATHGDVSELCKYVGKDLGTAGGFVRDATLLQEFLHAMWGRRTWSTFGGAFKVVREPDELDERLPCDCCGSLDHEAVERISADAWERRKAAQGSSGVADRQLHGVADDHAAGVHAGSQGPRLQEQHEIQ